MRYLLFTLTFVLATSGAFAGRPMKVIYKKVITRNFAWKWPPRRVTTYTFIKKHRDSSAQVQKGSALTGEDVAKYRFHHPQYVYQNEWGYFFPPGTKAVPNGGAVVFTSPNGYVSANTQK